MALPADSQRATINRRRPTREDVKPLYGFDAGSFRLDQQEFRFSAIRPDLGNIDIDPLVQTCEWRDEGTIHSINIIPVLRGGITLTKQPVDQRGAQLTLSEGHRIRCEVRWAGEWKHLWEMRVQKPALQLEDGSWSFEMADDLLLLSSSSDSFKYRRGKRKKRNGWRYDEIVRDVAKKYRIPLGSIVKGRHRIKNLAEVDDVSPLECIRRAVEEESEWTGRRYVIRWAYSAKAGRYALSITHPRRNPLLYVLADQIQRGSVETIRDAKLATAITATGSAKKKGSRKAKKYTVKLFPSTSSASAEAVRRYGFIHKEITFTGIDSEDELERKAKRHLAKHLKPTYRITLSHYGIAFLRRGDAVQISLPEAGLRKIQTMWVVSVAHSVAGGSYSMDLELMLRDPLDPEVLRKEKNKAERARKRAKKGKKK